MSSSWVWIKSPRSMVQWPHVCIISLFQAAWVHRYESCGEFVNKMEPCDNVSFLRHALFVDKSLERVRYWAFYYSTCNNLYSFFRCIWSGCWACAGKDLYLRSDSIIPEQFSTASILLLVLLIGSENMAFKSALCKELGFDLRSLYNLQTFGKSVYHQTYWWPTDGVNFQSQLLT